MQIAVIGNNNTKTGKPLVVTYIKAKTRMHASSGKPGITPQR